KIRADAVIGTYVRRGNSAWARRRQPGQQALAGRSQGLQEAVECGHRLAGQAVVSVGQCLHLHCDDLALHVRPGWVHVDVSLAAALPWVAVWRRKSPRAIVRWSD